MIHPTAIIDKEAILEEPVNIGAYAVIEKNVRIGKNVTICPYAHIAGNTTIGDNNFIGTGAVIGQMPQILGIKENLGRLFIGNNNVIREYVTIHTSSLADKTTTIGNNNYFMAFSHIAHDCEITNNVVICNGSLIAGHVQINENAFISGNVVVHQFVRIGRLAMIGGLSRVNQDVLPFMLLVGDSKIWGLNLVGLKRKGFGSKEIAEIKKAFNIIYRSKLSLSNAVRLLKNMSSKYVEEIIEFILSSKRGICGPHRSTFFEKLFLDYPYLFLLKIPTYKFFIKSYTKSIS
ncbi:MAG: acyl-ACP--UDP-N-acetylglucosamine O-acyltransferase [Candidatus Omnitrophica bacterium]|nr:acyl-ACP--UDP-N-acetylglucosamine O-acyltransferase [Candidatus Omnitrophota bacterium]